MECKVCRKEKLNTDEQIEYMEEQGIKFVIFSKIKAKLFLEESNYYFKVKSFAKNYKKDSTEKYINLDFAYLRKFSILDTAFRDLILELSLMCEHLLKTTLCSYCSQNISDDGYEVISKYLENDKNLPKELERYNQGKKSVYSQDLLEKYVNNFAVWNFVEILTFNELLSFYKFYVNHFSIKESINLFNIYAIKSLRNVAAHNTCILNTLTSRPIDNFRTSTEISQFLKKNKILSSRGKIFKVPMIHDFICIIYVFSKLCPDTKMKNITKEKIDDFFNKFEKRYEYYTNPLIIQRYEFIKKATNYILSKL